MSKLMSLTCQGFIATITDEPSTFETLHPSTKKLSYEKKQKGILFESHLAHVNSSSDFMKWLIKMLETLEQT